ncbi:MAG: hypothetical protein ABII06_07105 [Pseudomonadota bacterium]
MIEIGKRIKNAILLLTGVFCVLFGVQILISAYGLKDPFFFVMTFFASNLIILIGIVFLVGFICRLAPFSKKSEDDVPRAD